jgi:hypothetical protein
MSMRRSKCVNVETLLGSSLDNTNGMGWNYAMYVIASGISEH